MRISDWSSDVCSSDLASGRGEDDVGRGRAEHDQVDLGGLDAGRFQRTHGGVVREVTGGFAFGRDVALADAGARGDPLVAGVDDLRQVVVGEHLFRQVAAGAGNPRRTEEHTSELQPLMSISY